jgi:hypothetical protein
MRRLPILDYASPSAPSKRRWPLSIILPVMAVIFILQPAVLRCACALGDLKLRVGYIVDGVIMVRVLVAVLLKETGRGWIIYLLVAASSFFWIPWAVHH